MAFSCTHTIQEVKGLEQKLTVGQHVFLDCTGEPALLEPAKAFFKDGSLKLFKVEQNSGSLKIDMTFYTAGNHDFSKLVLTDGTNEVTLGGPQVRVESVLKPGADGKPPQPYDSIFPIELGIPFSYFLYLAGALLLVLIFSVIKARRLAYPRPVSNVICRARTAA